MGQFLVLTCSSLIAGVSDTTYQINTSEKAVAYIALILLLEKSVFIFNKSRKKEQHITMKAVGLQHCTCIFLRHSRLPLSPGPRGADAHTRTRHTPEAGGLACSLIDPRQDCGGLPDQHLSGER